MFNSLLQHVHSSRHSLPPPIRPSLFQFAGDEFLAFQGLDPVWIGREMSSIRKVQDIHKKLMLVTGTHLLKNYLKVGATEYYKEKLMLYWGPNAIRTEKISFFLSFFFSFSFF